MKSVAVFIRKILWYCLPVIFCGITYFFFDPFKVLRDYDSYYVSGKPCYVTLDRDHVSAMMFKRYNSAYHYDSFILGNSRTLFYPVSEWRKFIGDSTSCFHFDASGESLYGIYKKIKFLDEKADVGINHLLLILDYSTLEQVLPRTSSHLFYLSPLLDNNENKLTFHFCFLKAYLHPRFLMAYLDFRLFGKVRRYMGNLLDDRPLTYQLRENEITFDSIENLIAEGRYYTPSRMKVFYERDTVEQKYSVPVIGKQQLYYLQEIRRILDQHATEYKVVINPLYDQLKLNEQDKACLDSVFGSEYVFDFSGINEYTRDYRNYYEASHYRPRVAIDILRRIYGQNDKNVYTYDYTRSKNYRTTEIPGPSGQPVDYRGI